MVNFLTRLFIKDSENKEDPKVRESYGKLAGIVGIISNLILFVMKIITGLLSGSIAITADAVNNLSDAGSSIVTLVGFHLSGLPADKEHPYGHGRYEYIAGLIVSFIIILIGFQLLLASINKIRFPEKTDFNWVFAFILAASILIKLWQSRFNKKLGRLIRSQALIATAADSLNDVISTSAVLISALISHFTGFELDGYMGLLVAAFIIYSGIGITRETIDPLLGTTPDEELVERIWQKLREYEGEIVLGYHDLMIHNYGPGRSFVTVHAEVPAERDILECHDLIDDIEAEFGYKLQIPLTIHMDPVLLNDEKVNYARERIEDILKTINPEMTFHDFRMVPGETHSNLIFDVVVDFGFTMEDMELKHLIRQRTREFNERWRTVVRVDRHYI
ncbi:MAG: cation diffusion facilitator family transporter [Clostridiales bacterium]